MTRRWGAVLFCYMMCAAGCDRGDHVDWVTEELRSSAGELVASTRSTFVIHGSSPAGSNNIGTELRSVLPDPVPLQAERRGSRIQFLSDGVAALNVSLPVSNSETTTLVDRRSGLGVGVTLLGATGAEAQLARGYLVYLHGHSSGADIIQRIARSSVEDYLVFKTKPDVASVSYKVQLNDRVAGLRSVANTVEFVDSDGDPKLRLDRPYLVDAKGRFVNTRLTVGGCSVDTNGLPPWNRPVTSPGSSVCTITARGCP